MLTLPLSTRVLVCRQPVDMRLSFDGLEAAVRERLQQDRYREPCSCSGTGAGIA
jgi:hypothetical protein